MSLSFHLGHQSHSLVKQFAQNFHRRTRASVKQEPFQDRTDDDMTANGSAPSSGSTVRNDDVEMTSGYQPSNYQPNESGIDRSFTVDTPNPSDDADSADSSTLLFGQRSKQLIEAIQGIATLGIDTTLTSLPKFVVVGDQSHGKSSIVEALCNISLPRSEGTCTRCPFQITTTGCNADAWTCEVSLTLRWEYNAGADDSEPYPYWLPRATQEIVKLATVDDKAQFEDTLRRAQLAILNPDRTPASVLQAHDISTKNSKLQFSPNIVSIRVSGASLPELSLFDLPGAINMAQSKSEKHIVPFVKRMMEDYVQDDKALVLLAASLSSDIDTSTAYKCVDDSGATERCMGVLTKPDLFVAQNTERIGRTLNDEIFQLGNGWFVTKQLSQHELDRGDVTYANARNREDAFFKTQQPWSTALRGHRGKFGIPNLQDALSRKLTEHILNDLPEINTRVDDRLHEVTSSLQQFPERPLQPCYIVNTEVANVVSTMAEQLRRDGKKKPFRDGFTTALKKLKEHLSTVRPDVILSTPGFEKATIDLSKEDDDTTAMSPNKMRKNNDSRPVSTPSSSHIEEPRERRTPKKEPGTAAVTSARKLFKLDDIQSRYESGTNSGIPEQMNPEVTDSLILESLQGWPQVVNKALAAIKTTVEKMIVRAINNTLAKRQQTQLFRHTTEIGKKVFTELMGKQRDIVQDLVSWEMSKPITYTSLSIAKKSAAQMLETDRSVVRAQERLDTWEENGYKLKPGDKQKAADALGEDPYAREVVAMALPLAYYDHAAARLVDNIAMSMENGLLGALEAKLRLSLIEGLNMGDVEHCAYLLADDPAREQERVRLMAEEEKLHQAREMLEGLAFPN